MTETEHETPADEPTTPEEQAPEEQAPEADEGTVEGDESE
jgi:hypothetical protein